MIKHIVVYTQLIKQFKFPIITNIFYSFKLEIELAIPGTNEWEMLVNVAKQGGNGSVERLFLFYSRITSVMTCKISASQWWM